MEQVLAPGVEHGEKAEFHTQTVGVARDREQSLGSGAKEDVIDGILVVECDGGDGFGESEDHVEVLLAKARVRWATTLADVAPATFRAPTPGTWGNNGPRGYPGRSDSGCACIGSGRTIRQCRP